MKVLTEQQIKTINDFENYKKMLRTKYCEMQKSMEMLAGIIKQPSKEAKELISVVQSCRSSLEERWISLCINNKGELCIKETGEEPIPIDDNEKKNKAIKSLLDKLSGFTFEIGKLMSFANTDEDMNTFYVEKEQLKLHTEKVIEIIMEQ